MKTLLPTKTWRTLAALAAGTWALQAIASEWPGGVRPVPMMTSDQFLVNGEVSSRTDTDLTILQPAEGRTITVQIADDTAITRGAATIRVLDLRVGEKVSVTVAREANGRLVAAKVHVRLKDEES